MRYMLTLAAIVAAGLVLGAAPASADPFYCDGETPSAGDSIQCGNTGNCYWMYAGNGWWTIYCVEPHCYYVGC
jgi:hypothetical protein